MSVRRPSARRRAWAHVIPFFAFPPEVRRVIYTTKLIESLHMQLRKIIKTRGHFPSDDAATKLLWLALRNVMRKSVRSTREWKTAMNQFAIPYGDRFTSSRTQMRRHRPADHFARPHVKHDRQGQKARPRRNVRDVSYPQCTVM
jgi:hypothetical protein